MRSYLLEDIPPAKWNVFKSACKKNGKTIKDVLLESVDDYIENNRISNYKQFIFQCSPQLKKRIYAKIKNNTSLTRVAIASMIVQNIQPNFITSHGTGSMINIPIHKNIYRFLQDLLLNSNLYLERVFEIIDKLPDTDFNTPQYKQFTVEISNKKQLYAISKDYGIKINDVAFILLCFQQHSGTEDPKEKFSFRLRKGDLSILSAIGLDLLTFYDNKDEIAGFLEK